MEEVGEEVDVITEEMQEDDDERGLFVLKMTNTNCPLPLSKLQYLFSFGGKTTINLNNTPPPKQSFTLLKSSNTFHTFSVSNENKQSK